MKEVVTKVDVDAKTVVEVAAGRVDAAEVNAVVDDETTVQHQHGHDKQRLQHQPVTVELDMLSVLRPRPFRCYPKSRRPGPRNRRRGVCAAGPDAVCGQSLQSDRRVLDLMPIEDGVDGGRDDFSCLGDVGAPRKCRATHSWRFAAAPPSLRVEPQKAGSTRGLTRYVSEVEGMFNAWHGTERRQGGMREERATGAGRTGLDCHDPAS
jgi:hypothetical protein